MFVEGSLAGVGGPLLVFCCVPLPNSVEQLPGHTGALVASEGLLLAARKGHSQIPSSQGYSTTPQDCCIQ